VLEAINDTIMFKPVNHVIEADIKGFFVDALRNLD